MKRVAWVMVVGLGACADSDAKDPCGSGTLVSGGAVCVMSGGITETGFDCPPEMPFEYGGQFDDGERWAMCSSNGELDPQAIEDAMHEAGMDDTPTDPNQPDIPDDGDPNDGDPNDDPEDCARPDPATGVCLDDTGPNDPGDPPDQSCIDEDADGSCYGMDLDDNDASVRGVGAFEVDGTTYIVACDDSGCIGIDVCLYVPLDAWEGMDDVPEAVTIARAECADYTGGQIDDDGMIDSYTTVCADDPVTATNLCWEAPVPCRDDAGHTTLCEQCVDANSNRICDDQEQ